ncbi:Protein SUPPRESSOR OF npr1-1, CONSTITUTIVE 1 [Morella rubra]|uniref:Protein SUPPRESSOR OF npr1-1, CONSTITUTIVE 1 n=1 Tax=Morella rubra TaxID=262757 RepID=A0A6A1V7Z7_9ROSI|nr:Protein SUPPRESSOR OF npr1-1, CONSTITUTIVE 1 [Morella rubra]
MYGVDKVALWRRAMERAGGITGWVFKSSNEAQAHLIESLLKRVLTELANTPVGVAQYIVGLDYRLKELMSMLDVRSNGIRVLGLYGMGGVGKTTTVKALYNKLVGHFECLSFIAKVRENSAKDNGLIGLQNKLIQDLSSGKVQGTGSIEGLVLDLEGRPFNKDPSGDTISWENLKRTPNYNSALAYFKEKHKKHLQNKAEKEREVVLCTESFESMANLRLLQINYTRLVGSYKYLPAQLKWLQWKGCPLKSLPSDFSPRELAVLDLSESAIEQVWGWHSSKVAEKLMIMNLRGCHNLAAIPDLSGHKSLEKLVLEHCHSLIKIHDSVGNASSLVHLNLRSCWNLIEFPAKVSGLKKLENLIFSGCSKLKELPLEIGSMRTLPNCIGLLSSLKELSLNSLAVEEIPSSVGSLLKLEKLSLMWCKSLTSIPDSIGNLRLLTELLINGSAIKELPASIGSLSYLKRLSLGSCQFLSKLPDSIEGLASIVEIQLDETSIVNLPDQVGALKMLRKFEMRNCKHLGSLPVSIGLLFALTTLTVFKASIFELPESIGMLENLIILRLNKCTQLRKLPDSIGNLKSLCQLLMEETAVTELPESFGMLSSLMILKMAKKPQFLVARNSVPEEVSAATEIETPNPVSLRNLSSLSMPGSKIPVWFSQQVVRFSEQRNRQIKGVIVGVVFSVNHQIPDDLRDQLPSIPFIRANITKLSKPIFSTMPELKGLPKTNEDHIYLCRYPECHPLVSKLRDGYDIHVTEQDPPYVKGIEVKHRGFYLIIEGEDDYDGDEASLNESQLSISEKLAKFFNSIEEEDDISESGCEVDSQVQEIEEQDERGREPLWGGFLRLVRGCFCF